MSDCVFHAKPELSAIFDPTLEAGIVLDDDDGDYWRLDLPTLALLQSLAMMGPASVEDLRTHGHADADRTLDNLCSIGLVRCGPPRRDARLARPRHRGKSQPLRRNGQDLPELPAKTSVLLYVLLNLRFQLEVLFCKWKPLRSRRTLCLPSADGTSEDERAAAEHVIACMRIASTVPLVSRSCIPRALTAFELLRRRGLAPRLVVGAYVEPFEPHVWAECGDEAIDSGHMDFSLQVFAPLREVELRV